jgi:CheY-like chemotaxis protein
MPASAPGPSHEWCDVLVVEDDPAIRDALVERLTEDLYVVRAASNGREALEIVRTTDIGVIVLDLLMPVMSGAEFLAEMSRTLPAKAHTVPTLVITASLNAARGVNAPVFLKPLDVESLLRAVRAYLGSRESGLVR